MTRLEYSPRRLHRRRFLGGLAGLGVAAAIPASRPRAQAAGNPRRIDVHHHTVAPHLVARTRDALIARNPYAGDILKWTPLVSLQQMDRYGIATAILSNTTDWTLFAPDEARSLCRDTNEYSAQLRADHPGRFGLFAAVPMLDLEGCLAEIDYAYATLKADGIQLLTSYGTQYPGDPAFDPLFAELNRRKALVFIHPSAPGCCGHLIPGIPAATAEFMFDVTRCITSLLFRGTFARFPDIDFIFTHDGAALPMLAERITRNAAAIQPAAFPTQQAAMATLQRLHYDVTTSTSRPALSALRNFVPVTQMLFGTDFPLLTPEETVPTLGAYGFTIAERAAINRGNAEKLFPRLKT